MLVFCILIKTFQVAFAHNPNQPQPQPACCPLSTCTQQEPPLQLECEGYPMFPEKLTAHAHKDDIMKGIWMLGPLCGLTSISLLFVDESYSSKTGMVASGVCLCVCTRALVQMLCINAQDRQFWVNCKHIHAHTPNTYARTRACTQESYAHVVWLDGGSVAKKR